MTLLDEIRQECKKKNALYLDKNFPASQASLFYSEDPDWLDRVEWKRPHEITSNPAMFDEGASRFDIEQGMLGDCWLLASLACLSMRKKLLDKVVPSDQSFDKNGGYCGAFHFYFWRAGEWVEIVVDDLLPTINGQLIFVHSKAENEFWSALVEKAYAKIFNSYEALKGGNMSEAMEDFTGGLTEPFALKPKVPADLFKIMRKAFERDAMMGCSVTAPPGQIEPKMPSGLIGGHAYSITAVRTNTVNVKRGGKMVQEKIDMIRIRNPWGGTEWNGAWSDDSEEMKNLTQKQREEMELTVDDDGEFWIAFDDFVANFDNVEICQQSPDEDDEDPTDKKQWVVNVEHSSWQPGATAGGCRNFKDTFHRNPQFFITLTDVDEDDDSDLCSLIIALYQKDSRVGRSSGKVPRTIGFIIYKVPDEYKTKNPSWEPGSPLPIKFFLTNPSQAKSPSFINSREIAGRYSFKPGSYVVVPSTFKPNEQARFMLRIYTEAVVEKQSLDTKIEYDQKKSKQARLSDENRLKYKNLADKFASIAGEDQEVDAFELLDVLNATNAFTECMTDKFTLDSCRCMLALYDADMSGKLGFKEFTELCFYICLCKEVFVFYDTDKSGTFSTFEMREALVHIGFTLDLKTFACIVTRYGDQNQSVDFNNFVLIACKLRSAFERYESMNVRVPIDQWLHMSIYS